MGAVSHMAVSPRAAHSFFNLEKASILVIDGDTMSMSIIVQILSGFGATHIVRAETIADARRHASSAPFTLIVIDPSTLGDEGYGFTPWLRRSLPPELRFAPVVVVTGHTQTSKVGAARDSGANFVVSKPLSPATLFDRIMWIAREKRPFVNCRAYAGPERRFHDEGPPEGMKGRRQDDTDLLAAFAPERELTQSEVNAIMNEGRRAT